MIARARSRGSGRLRMQNHLTTWTCYYPALDARLSSALRACTQSPALKSRIDKLTAESHKNPRLGFPSTKIIWCIIDHHRASVQGQETVLIGELFGMKMPAITQKGGESQLEKFLNSWEVVEAQIQVPIDEQLKLHIFFQQVSKVPSPAQHQYVGAS